MQRNGHAHGTSATPLIVTLLAKCSLKWLISACYPNLKIAARGRLIIIIELYNTSGCPRISAV